MIDFMNLKISFGKKIIVKEMNDQFSENKIIGLVAPNGTGKTTLLRTLAGIKKPADGYVKINGLDFYSEREEYLKQIFFLENSDQLYQI
jgi:ABC-2 type transport system ATP-binding protein